MSCSVRSGVDAETHFDEIFGEACFFVGDDGGLVVVVDVQAEFGDALADGPLFKGDDDLLIDTFAAVCGLDIHESEAGVVGVFEVVQAFFDTGVSGADEGAVQFGYDDLDLGGRDHIGDVVVVDGVWFEGWVEGAFGGDDALFEAEQRVEVCVSGGSDDELGHG